jgi:hypothetical protein
VAGGTGDFAGANGDWTWYHTGACEWTGDLGDWQGDIAIAGTGSLMEVTLSHGGTFVKWVSGPHNPCDLFDDLWRRRTAAPARDRGAGRRDGGHLRAVPGDDVSCCGNTIPSALNLTLTGGTCSGSSTVFWNGTDWQGDITLTGGTGGTLHATLSCSGSTWTASFTGCDTFGGTVTGTCSPFDRSGIPSATICCGGGSMTARFFE